MTFLIFAYVILFLSLILHELGHGYAADYYGDSTPRDSGRLTLNPLAHMDLVGTLILPVVSYFLVGFMMGWLKPVPVDPSNLGGGVRRKFMNISLAGPAVNFALALAGALIFRAGFFLHDADPVFRTALQATVFGVVVNIFIGLVNLVPVPPLDGSKVLAYFLPGNIAVKFYEASPNWFIIVFPTLYILAPYIARGAFGIASILLGVPPLSFLPKI